MALSVRLDPKTESLVRRLAMQKGETKSQVIRQAIRVFAGHEGHKRDPLRPFEAISHLIGCARGGPRDLSEQARRRRLQRAGETRP